MVVELWVTLSDWDGLRDDGERVKGCLIGVISLWWRNHNGGGDFKNHDALLLDHVVNVN